MENLLGTSVTHAANPFVFSEDPNFEPTLCGKTASHVISSAYTSGSVDCKKCLSKIATVHALALRINETIDKGVTDAREHVVAGANSLERGWDDAKLADKINATEAALAQDIVMASEDGLKGVVESWIIARAGFLTLYRAERLRRQRNAAEIEAHRIQHALDTATMSAERVALATPNWEPVTTVEGGLFAQNDQVLANEVKRMREQTGKYLSGEWSYGDDLGLVRDHAHVTRLMELELARRTRQAQDFEAEVAQVERTQEQKADERVRLVRAEDLQRALVTAAMQAGRPEPSQAELEGAVVSSDHSEAVEEDRARFPHESFTRMPEQVVTHRLGDGTVENVWMIGTDVSRTVYPQNMVLIVRDTGIPQVVAEGDLVPFVSWPAVTDEGVICGNCTHRDSTGDRVIMRHISASEVGRCYKMRYQQEDEALAEQAAERQAERFYEEGF